MTMTSRGVDNVHSSVSNGRFRIRWYLSGREGGGVGLDSVVSLAGAAGSLDRHRRRRGSPPVVSTERQQWRQTLPLGKRRQTRLTSADSAGRRRLEGEMTDVLRTSRGAAPLHCEC